MTHIVVSRLLKPLGSLVCLVGLFGGSFIANSAASSFANESAGNPEFGIIPPAPAQLGAAFTVSGRVSSGQNPLVGATITFERTTGTGTVPPAVRTDIKGNWSQSGFSSGTTYRATPATVGFTFRPGSIDFRSAGTSLNFEGLNSAFTASGIVRAGQTTGLPAAPGGGKPPGIEGVTITFSRVTGTGALPAPVRTDAGGGWSQTGFQAGTTYRAAASKQGFVFNPASMEISRPTSESGRVITGLIFEGSSIEFRGSGKVSTADGRGIPQVKIRFSLVSGTGAVPAEVVTDEQGRWSQTGFERGTVYRITPSRLAVDTFNPRSIDNLTSPPPNAVAQTATHNFLITIPKFKVSGRVATKSRGTGIANVTVKFFLRLGAGQVPASVTTNERGEWSQEGFEMGTRYAATATAFPFAPTAVIFSSSESTQLRDVDFVVPDTFAIGGRLTTTDPELRRPLVATIEIKAVSGRGEEVFCVKTPLGVPWIQEGLDTTKTYKVTPEITLEIPNIPGARLGSFVMFGPPSVRVQGPRTDVNFSVSIDRITVATFGPSPCR
jgi:hypothetical protein